MPDKPKSLDDLFGDYEREQRERAERDAHNPEARRRLDEKRKAEIEKEIRQGLRDADGNWIDQPDEPDEEGEEDEPEENDD